MTIKNESNSSCIGDLNLFLLVENMIREYGLWAVLLGAMFEGEMTLLFAGVLAHYGLFSFAEVFVSGARSEEHTSELQSQ